MNTRIITYGNTYSYRNTVSLELSQRVFNKIIITLKSHLNVYKVRMNVCLEREKKKKREKRESRQNSSSLTIENRVRYYGNVKKKSFITEHSVLP